MSGQPGGRPGAVPVKAVVVGDTGTGKSSLVHAYTDGEFPEDHVADGAPFSVLSRTTGVRGELCEVALWDTSGAEEMDRLRPLCYAHADVFFLCFSIVQPESYESVRSKWSREVGFHAGRGLRSSGASCVLVGLMADLRTDPNITSRLAAKKLAPIQPQQGQSLAHELGAKCYVECSALTGLAALNEAVEKAIAAVLPAVKANIAAELASPRAVFKTWTSPKAKPPSPPKSSKHTMAKGAGAGAARQAAKTAAGSEPGSPRGADRETPRKDATAAADHPHSLCDAGPATADEADDDDGGGGGGDARGPGAVGSVGRPVPGSGATGLSPVPSSKTTASSSSSDAAQAAMPEPKGGGCCSVM